MLSTPPPLRAHLPLRVATPLSPTHCNMLMVHLQTHFHQSPASRSRGVGCRVPDSRLDAETFIDTRIPPCDDPQPATRRCLSSCVGLDLALEQSHQVRRSAGAECDFRTTTSQKCEAVERRARISGSQTCVSLNSRMESNTEEDEECVCVSVAALPRWGGIHGGNVGKLVVEVPLRTQGDICRRLLS